MFDKIGAFWRVVKTGEQVSDPVKWKKGQISVSVLVAFLGALLAVAKAFGYELPITDEQIASIAGGILAVVGVFNQYATAASTDKVGITGREHVPAMDRRSSDHEEGTRAGNAPGPESSGQSSPELSAGNQGQSPG